MHPLLSSFCTELVKEASPRWMREAARDPSVLRGLGVRSGVEQMQPFLDNPQGVLAPGGREVRSGLKLDPTASHLSDVKHWPDAKSVLEGSTNTSDILHAHRNPDRKSVV